MTCTSPRDSSMATYFRANSSTPGRAELNRSSSVNRPHECHRLRLINRAPHSGHVQTALRSPLPDLGLVPSLRAMGFLTLLRLTTNFIGRPPGASAESQASASRSFKIDDHRTDLREATRIP